MDIMATQITNNLTVQLFVKANLKESIKAHVTGPLWEESCSDQRIPLTKGQ